ncbi:MAG: MFS transporter, partial [Candidatus Saccharimonas sp.]|nr:MFS transporter [Planctomycetaceae bacterium]
MPATPSPPAAIDSREQMSGVYGHTFWLAYLANSALVLAHALTFRFAELVNHLGGTESVAGDIVAVGTAVAVVLRLSASHVLDDYGTRRMWPLCAMLFVGGCLTFLAVTQLSWVVYAARIAYFVGLTGMFACSMTHIQNHVPPERRTEIIGNLGSSGFVGMILGSNIGDLVLRFVPDKRTQFLILFGGAALIGTVYLVIVILLTRDQQHERHA